MHECVTFDLNRVTLRKESLQKRMQAENRSDEITELFGGAKLPYPIASYVFESAIHPALINHPV